MKRDERDGNTPRPSRGGKRAARRNVVFELPAPAYEALQQDAENRGLVSIHQRGREIVVDYLNHGSTEDIPERISALEQEVAHVSELVRRVAFAVITSAGKPSDEANQWVRNNMPRLPERRIPS
jgi:hypothetical protein